MPKALKTKALRKTGSESEVTNTIGEIIENKVGGIPKLITPIEFKTRNQKRLYKAIESPKKIIGEKETTRLIELGKLEFKVLNFLRGMNFNNTYIFMDESQNASPAQLKTLITRIADDSKMVICGDLSQCDKFKANGVPAYQKSGFYDIWKRLSGVEGIYQVEFSKEDCV
jgi:phosphate starvation-inducible protein PhoH